MSKRHEYERGNGDTCMVRLEVGHITEHRCGQAQGALVHLVDGLTEADLDRIEGRLHAAAQLDDKTMIVGTTLVTEDVPRLLAEVRALRDAADR